MDIVRNLGEGMPELLPRRAKDDIDELLRALARTSAMQAVILAREEDGTWLVAAECGGASVDMNVGDDVRAISTLCAVVAHNAAPLVVANAVRVDEQGPASFVGVPLLHVDGSLLGVLFAIDRQPRSELGDVAHLFETLARVIASELVLVGEASASREALERETETAGSRERFLATVAHDLRTPVAAIRAAATLIERRPDDVESVTRSAHRIVHSAARMERLIADLLDMSRGRIGAGIPIAKRVSTEARSVITSVIEEVALAFPAVRLDVLIDLPMDLAVRWDLDRIAQCVGNLLANACAHGLNGAPVDIRVLDADDVVELTIRNAGEIASEARATLLDPLRAATGKRRVGLGLFIAGRIVQAHGGSIDFASDNGTTSTRLRLPKVTHPTSRRQLLS